MGMIGDFVAGAGAVGAQMGMDAVRSQIEEERATRLAEMQNRFATQRSEREIQARREDVATKRATDLADAPILAGIQTTAAVDKERQVRNLPPAPAAQLSPEDKALKEGQRDYYKAGAERLRAEAAAIASGQKYDRSGAAGARETAAIERNAKTAGAEIMTALKAEKDENGVPRYDGESLMKFGALASALVRHGGYDPQQAATLARSAPIKSGAEIGAQVTKEEESLPRVGFIRGALTGGGVERGDVQVGDKTMKIDDWRKQRAAELRSENDREVSAWAGQQGVSLAGARGGGGAPYADGTILERDGKRFEVRNGRPVEMDAGDKKAPAAPVGNGPKTSEPAKPEAGDALMSAGRALEGANPELKRLGDEMRLTEGPAQARARAAYLKMVDDLQKGRQPKRTPTALAPGLIGG